MSQFENFMTAVKENNLEQVKIRYHSDFLDEIYSGYFAGYRPIHFSCQRGYVDITKFLLEKGCDKEALTEMRTRPLHIAAIKGHIDIMKLLIKHKCNLEAAGIKGYRAIHFAVQSGHLNVVKELLERKCDIEAEDTKGHRPIHIVAKSGDLEICRLLIKYGCNIEAEDNGGLRPAHIAATRGRASVLKELLLNKCDGLARTKFHATPLDAARHRQMKECVLMLERYNNSGETSPMTVDKADVKTLRKNFERMSISIEEDTKIKENTMCSMCVSTIKDCVLDCGHKFCLKCAGKMEICRICDKRITKRRRSSCFIIDEKAMVHKPQT